MQRLAATVVLIVAALAASGCAGFRGATRSTFNTDMVGSPAPALTGTEWVFPPDEPFSTPPDLAASWALVEFVDPG